MKKFTKSTLSLMLVLCMLFVSFTACENKDAQIKMTYLGAEDDDGKILPSEHAEYLRSVLDNSEWVRGVPKVRCSYQFELGRRIIKYSPDPSILSDEAKERYIILTEEQRDYINSVIIGMQTNGQDENLANKEQLYFSASSIEEMKEMFSNGEIQPKHDNDIFEKVINNENLNFDEYGIKRIVYLPYQDSSGNFTGSVALAIYWHGNYSFNLIYYEDKVNEDTITELFTEIDESKFYYLPLDNSTSYVYLINDHYRCHYDISNKVADKEEISNQLLEICREIEAMLQE